MPRFMGPTLLAKLPNNIRFLTIIVIVMVGLWLFITPFYEWVVETFKINPIWSIIIGAIIVYIGVKKWRLHPW